MPRIIDRMFRISDPLAFKPEVEPGRERLIPTFAHTERLSEAVVQDLKERFPGVEPEVTDRNQFNDGAPYPAEHHLDFGGMHWTGWVPERFEIGSLTFSFYAHHLDHVYQAIENAQKNLYLEGSFARIRTWHVFMAVRPDVLLTLHEMVRAQDAELRVKADKAFEEHAQSMKELRGEGARISPPLHERLGKKDIN